MGITFFGIGMVRYVCVHRSIFMLASLGPLIEPLGPAFKFVRIPTPWVLSVNCRLRT